MTLTQAAILTRRGIIIFGLIIILLISSKIGLGLYHQYQLSKIPPPQEVPELKFGLLPAITFPPAKVTSSNYSYSIDTTTGELPQAPSLLKVYFIPQSSLTLLAPDKARDLAHKLGFTNGPLSNTTDIYTFTDDNGGKLTLNVLNGNFKYIKNTATPSAENITQFKILKPQLIEDFKRFLSTKITVPQELLIGSSSLKVNNEANPTQAMVSLKPADFDSMPIITSSVNQGLVKASMVPAETFDDRFQSVEYTYWSIDTSSSSTYPVKSASQALSDLKSGQGYIAIAPPSPQVSITSVKLAYYQQDEYTPYLQPVFLFEGPSFAAIVPAITR